MATMKRDNNGFTLVELLVVIAILSVLIGAVSMSMSLAFSRDAERCAKTIDIELEQARMDAMSKRGSFQLNIDSLTHSMTWQRDVDGTMSNWSGENLQNQVSLTFQTGDGSALSEVTSVAIVFDKATGAVQSITDQSGKPVTGNLLRIRAGNRTGNKVATVVLIRRTGKHYVEYQ